LLGRGALRDARHRGTPPAPRPAGLGVIRRAWGGGGVVVMAGVPSAMRGISCPDSTPGWTRRPLGVGRGGGGEGGVM
jgi:hypothetical protein